MLRGETARRRHCSSTRTRPTGLEVSLFVSSAGPTTQHSKSALGARNFATADEGSRRRPNRRNEGQAEAAFGL
eukprot:1774230-Pleurochrysis_carterae.AAC.1